ncbi:hypothetical protein [Paraburkholderia humisilvae]|uniref:Uncharacterized protein n=1 Tax=Paraburkholderia humisilvae TaxID=627669 RepID=A0A6J5ECN1_9BURK|nr:hypothetical protein [Paraburkholderia humisilvae]CAB3764370.1 hypothetical protein LMG29542_04878 [Paraburkholderia humisilvae]
MAMSGEMAGQMMMMQSMQAQSQQFQMQEQQLNLENSCTNAAAQFSNSCCDNIKSAAK